MGNQIAVIPGSAKKFWQGKHVTFGSAKKNIIKLFVIYRYSTFLISCDAYIEVLQRWGGSLESTIMNAYTSEHLGNPII